MIRPVLLLALLAALVQPQPDPEAAVARYHEGARAFVDGEIEQARAAVEAGLRAAPDDARLQALRALIEQEQEEQDQREGGQPQDQEQNPQDSGDDEGQQNPGEGQQPPPPDDPEAEADQTRTDPGQTGEDEAEGQSGQRPGQGEATPEGDAEGEVGQMSRAQAERILDAVGGEEQLLLRELQRRPTRARHTDKDW